MIMNMIPTKPFGRVFDYFCTFSSQGHISLTRPEWKGMDARDALTYDILFSEKDGLLTAVSEDVRGDLLVLLDDGWDVPLGQQHDYENDVAFGSCIPDAQKFPPYAHLEGKYRLKALVDDIVKLGYAGVGLWVPSHHFHEDLNKSYGERQNDCIPAWEEIGKMCAYADIKYLKVDWGYHGRDVIYRRNMNKAVKKYAPDVIMEHVIGVFDKPFDEPVEKLRDNESYKTFMNTGLDTIKISDVYRTYDTVTDFDDPTTLMRLAEMFVRKPETDKNLYGLFNIENSAVIAAALGMCTGLMRHVNMTGKDDENEYVKAVKWHRIAPAFRIDGSENFCGGEQLLDYKHYEPDDTRWWCHDEITVTQSAPSLLSRNAPLAEVAKDENGNMPFVVNSLNPVTDAYTVAAIPRLIDGIKTSYPCDVALKGAKLCGKLGVFGYYKTLAVEFDEELTGAKVYAQNLLCGAALDITDKVEICGNTLKISGEVVTAVGKSDGDGSMPGIVISIKN